jgi:hypothetical protein
MSVHCDGLRTKAARGRHASSEAELNEEEILGMTKTLEIITEAVRNPKHPFRKVDNQPKKNLKHRYERRKIREYLHLGALATEELALEGLSPVLSGLTSSATSDARV